MLNKYQWRNYLISGGEKTVKIFEDVLEYKNIFDYTSKIRELVSAYCPFDFQCDVLEENLIDLLEQLPIEKSLQSTIGSMTMDFLYREIEKEVEYNGEKSTDKNVLDYFLLFIETLSTEMSLKNPEEFIPWYFVRNFNVFTYIVDMFKIKLNTKNIPLKSDYKGRFYYYGEICKTLHNFRKENNLSVAQLWAFLYDYAPKCVGGTAYINKSLPEPSSAFFIGGSGDDVFYNPIKFKNSSIAVPWQCSPNTRAGDMIVFYMTYPDSKIDSVFRSVSEGFIDPFFWYYRCCYISHFQKIENDVFTIKFMKTDPVFKNLPIVKKNMQGVNGTEIPAKNYNYIIKKSGLKNPILIKKRSFKFDNNSKIIIKNEHDVELKILEPLLEKLGWEKGDYVTQMVLKMGRSEK